MTEFLMSIRQNNECIWYIGYDDEWKIVTEWQIGDNTYDNFVDLIRWLQWFDIKIDDFYF